MKTIYFGGGTPSILSSDEIEKITTTVYENYTISDNPEITLEANPDDLNSKKIVELKNSKINRLSIGIQSFYEKDLKLMNRSHTAKEALKCITEAQKYFENISIDLIYGIPKLSNKAWLLNIEKAISLGVPHISCYALTVEPNTALEKQIKKGTFIAPSDAAAKEHHHILTETLREANYINYEFSNFGKEGFFSKNNIGYWQGKKYLGIGPSSHSFNGKQRSWNIANNNTYIKGIEKGVPNYQVETLSKTDCFNEYIMTGLRTKWGISLKKIKEDFGKDYLKHINKSAQKHLQTELLEIKKNHLHITDNGKFLTDGIASDLFLLN